MEQNSLEQKFEEIEGILETTPLDSHNCSLCNKISVIGELVSGNVIRKTITDVIKEHFNKWNESSLVCSDCVSKYRAEYIEHILEKEKGELSKLESDVIDSLQNHELLTKNVNEEYQESLSIADRTTDMIVKFGGSWFFIVLFAIVLVLWMVFNTYAIFFKPIDPYPFIFMNFILSTLAAFQAPFVLMSQNRQAIKEKVRSESEYKVNLKSELEIRHLNSKMDQLLTNQWSRLLKIQQVQTDLIHELISELKKKR